MHPAIAALVALGGLLVPSCGGPGPDASAGEELAGRAFASTEVTGHELVAGTRVELRFGEGTLGAEAGCNRLGADVRLGPATIEVSEVVMTEMSCGAAADAQDAWLRSFVADGPSWRLDDGVLTLTSAEGSIVAEEVPAVDEG